MSPRKLSLSIPIFMIYFPKYSRNFQRGVWSPLNYTKISEYALDGTGILFKFYVIM